MGWTTRNGRRYYARCWLANGRLHWQYVGPGLKGEQAHAEDVARRQQQQEQRQAFQGTQTHWQATQQPLNDLLQGTDFLTRAMLVLSGYFKHGGEWRRKRNVHNPDLT
jgi:hypothetical protein